MALHCPYFWYGHTIVMLFFNTDVCILLMDFPGGSDSEHLPAVKETGFDPWVVRIPFRREWLPTPAFSPGEFRGWRSQSFIPKLI